MRVTRPALPLSRTAVVIGWLLFASVAVFALTTVDHSATSVLAYVGVWLLSTTLPGVLFWRALARPTTRLQEFGFGSVLGIALLLLAWLPATLLHRPALMWLLPIGTVAASVAVPSLRLRVWSRRDAISGPARWHAAMMLVCSVAFVRFYFLILHVWHVPPSATSTVFQDSWYELALTQALRRSVAIDDPSVSGVPLHYHWFSNAHAAATQELSGVPAPQIVLHLWLVCMLLTFAFVTAAATERILEGSDAVKARHWWAGPLAAFLAVALPATMFLGTPRQPAVDDGFVPSSTSGVLALVVVLAFVGPVLDLLHGRGRRGTWILLALLIALGAGTKPSLLPVIACGGLLAGIAQWVTTKRFPVVPALLTAIPVLLVPIAALAVVGSTGGSRLQLFATLSLDPALGEAAGNPVTLPGHGGWLAPALANGSGHVWAVGAGLLALFILVELPRLIGLASPLNSTLRHDLGTWWCTGVVGSGFAGLWVLAHPGYSQHYFWRIVIPLGIVLSVTMVVRLLPGSSRRALPAVVVVVVAGIAAAAVSAVADPHPVLLDPTKVIDYAVSDRLVPYALAAAVLAVAIVVLRLVSPRLRWASVPAVALVTCFVCAMGTTMSGFELARTVQYRSELSAVDPFGSRYVTGAEQRAALWLGTNSGPTDVVATNVFCVPVRYRPTCKHVAFWLSGLSGRQLFVGPWAYTEKSLNQYGVGGNLTYDRLPSPWPDRVDLSLEAVRSPSSTVTSDLQKRGVKWIYADRRATNVSPLLARFATLRYSNDDVLIYRLDKEKGTT